MPSARPFAALLAAVVCAAGCSDAPPAASGDAQRSGPAVVLTVNYPLAYFAQRVGDEHVKASYPGPAGKDPAVWRPAPEDVAQYQAADLIVLNGADYAKWLDTVSLPPRALVDSSADFRDQLIDVSGSAMHTHGPAGPKSQKSVAHTTWLDPQQAVAQAEAIRRRLAKARPQQAESFQRNFDALTADLMQLDQQLEQQAKRLADQPLLCSQPIYQYLARRYKLSTKSLLWEPDQPPSEDQWEELAAMAESHPAKLMLWAAEPLETTVAKLKQLGIESVVFDPCGNVPESGDYLDVMRSNVDRLQAVTP